MSRRFIAELQPGERIEDDVFLVRSKDLRTTTQGSLYIHAVLADRTGQLVARVWQATEAMFNAIPEGGFMRFRGRTENYKGNLQFIVEAVSIAAPDTFDMADFLPTTRRDVDEMWARAQEILGTIEHPDLKALVNEFLADEPLMAQFRKAPAAAAMHHAYLGGLLEHTLSLLEVATRIMPLYPELSQDLVLTGLFLHDLGKTQELNYETAVTYSDEGQLLGHIVQVVMMVDRKTRDVAARTGKPFPEQVRWLVQHLIVAHHGTYEFGSPKLPAIPEAAAIHYLDNLDAKINTHLSEIANDRDPASRWTNYHRGLETKIYKVDLFGTRRQAD
jgi:3'-5' exoribonuclease